MNYYDDMKSMLGITRCLSKRQLNEDLSREVSPEEYAAEIDKFKKAVSASVQFDQDYRSFKIYEGYVEWNGILLQEQISFIYTTENVNGVYISGNQVQITDDSFQTISRLTAYYDTWSEYWSTQLNGGNQTNPAPETNPQEVGGQSQRQTNGGENGQI